VGDRARLLRPIGSTLSKRIQMSSDFDDLIPRGLPRVILGLAAIVVVLTIVLAALRY
jgi:hypothetical protein